jgi:predicted Zn finger-like uncharacterized protein
VIIRCDRCSTVFELDEGLLAPEGSPVQCSRCANIFTARPQRAAGQALPGSPRAAQPQAAAGPAPAAKAPAADPPRPSVRPTPARTAPAVYRPAPSAGPAQGVSRAPTLRRDTVGAFESRLRRKARWRWLAPAAVVALAAAAGGAWLTLRRPPEPTGRAVRAEALALAERDDAASLERAASRLAGVSGSVSQPAPAEADRALVELLSATGAGKGRGAEEAATAHAREALSRAAGAAPAAGEVARARAVLAAMSGDRDEVRRQVTAARATLAGDVWAGLAEVWVEARSADRSVRDRAIPALGAFAEHHPELIRARYALAQALAAAGRRSEAIAAAEVLLARNPSHEGAAGLKADLERPPPQAPVPAPVRPLPPVAPPMPTPVAVEPPAAPVVEKPAATGRKPASQPVEPPVGLQAAAPSGEAPAAAPRRGAEPQVAPGPAEVGGAPRPPEAGAEDPGVAPKPSRVRPAAVPQPEPVLSGE